MTQLADPLATSAAPQICGDPKCGRETVRPLRRGICDCCYERLRHRQTAYGRWENGRVAADPVRAHIAALKDAGVSYRRITVLAGLNRAVLQSVLHGKGPRTDRRRPPQWITKATAEKILAVEIPEDPITVAADKHSFPAFGAQRRLRALVAAGWPMVWLAEQLGMSPGNFGALIHRHTSIGAARHRRVAVLFEEQHMVPGPSESARAYAKARGWALPMQWDEDSLDDPQGRPVPGSRRRERSA